MRSLLCLEVPPSRRVSKLYCIVMAHLAAKIKGKRVKEQLVRRLVLTLGSIRHEEGFFRLLACLRAAKNTVALHYQDVVKGGVFSILVKLYPLHLNSHRSYHILDCLNHLLALFPTLASHIPPGFPCFLLDHTQLQHMHHPLHLLSVTTFVEMALPLLPNCQEVLAKLVRVRPSSLVATVRLGEILANCRAE